MWLDALNPKDGDKLLLIAKNCIAVRIACGRDIWKIKGSGQECPHHTIRFYPILWLACVKGCKVILLFAFPRSRLA
jgi:hypothetical protein